MTISVALPKTLGFCVGQIREAPQVCRFLPSPAPPIVLPPRLCPSSLLPLPLLSLPVYPPPLLLLSLPLFQQQRAQPPGLCRPWSPRARRCWTARMRTDSTGRVRQPHTFETSWWTSANTLLYTRLYYTVPCSTSQPSTNCPQLPHQLSNGLLGRIMLARCLPDSAQDIAGPRKETMCRQSAQC